ncbi:helix-turn-helix domain-containing protein [Stakelama sp. CBK3Z-3]|uniref:Helix-turn-helix domain-containing protein n=1 Tax=Stakelama flava TaxID=2860338 RepID=A0ABS6XQS9_9SPHN|nr:helix-turn-helix domain-containing protein [Stakelama flava]MBW4332239.1 helix-turn-helix domain-containing protein [Stakelama flava]
MDDENARAAIAREGCPYLNTGQAAFHLGLSPRTLETMRRTGRGPRFRRHGGSVRYHINDLDGWSHGDDRETGRG